VGENTCASRIRRGLIRLRDHMARRGFAVGAAGLAALFLQAHAAEGPAPAGLSASIHAGGTAAARTHAAGASSMSTILIPLVLVTGIAGGGFLLDPWAVRDGSAGSATAADSAPDPVATRRVHTPPDDGGTPGIAGGATTPATVPLGGSQDLADLRVRSGTADQVIIAVGDAGDQGAATPVQPWVATWTTSDGSSAFWLGINGSRPEVVPATVAAAVRASRPVPGQSGPLGPGHDGPPDPTAREAPEDWICVALVSAPVGNRWSHEAVLVPASAVVDTGLASRSGSVLITVTAPFHGSALIATAALRQRLWPHSNGMGGATN
jgi:hypothetical protein